MSVEAIEKICPLCTEQMDLTDQQLKPCKCGYEICVWCWHHIMEMAEKDDTEGRCPACRTPYDKEKIYGTASNCEKVVSEISVERKKLQKAKTKTSEGRKQLTDMRVIRRNLVYIVGLPLILADEDLLQQKDFFGQYGKVLKVSMSRTAAGVIQQFPNNTCSVYITYCKEEEAIRCIQCVHGFTLDGRSLKACFGTTKYCHAWLRNVPCNNPDCLYLHEIGSQEDSFTKDDIISAYTRSRIQQITGATSNMLRRSGSKLPPPLDDYINNSLSLTKSIPKNVSNNMSTSRSSPPRGSIGKAAALPVAASWGTRSSSQQQAACSSHVTASSKSRPETPVSGSTFSSAVACGSQASTTGSKFHSDIGNWCTWKEENQTTECSDKTDTLRPLDYPNIEDAPPTALTHGHSSCSLLPPQYYDWEATAATNAAPSCLGRGPYRGHENEPVTQNDGGGVHDVSGFARNGILLSDQHTMAKSLVQGPQIRGDQHKEPIGTAAMLMNNESALSDQFNWRSCRQSMASNPTATATTTATATGEVEDDVISFDNQRMKDPEVVGHAYLPNSASLHVTSHSMSHPSEHHEGFATSFNTSANSQFVDRKTSDRTLFNLSNNSLIPNGYSDNFVAKYGSSKRSVDQPFIFPKDTDNAAALDVGESNIMSNLLSLDLDAWDEQPSRSSCRSWSLQSNNQPRGSLARREESLNPMFDGDRSFRPFGNLAKNNSLKDFSENRNSYLDKIANHGGFSSGNFEEFRAFNSNFSPNRLSVAVSRDQISVPPGFPVPNRVAPPGFSSHERLNPSLDNVSGNHLLDHSLRRNVYPTRTAGSIGSMEEIEFMDPAILAVGKGRQQGRLNSSVLGVRSNFSQQQLNAYENEARLQLLMHKPNSALQNLRYGSDGDRFLLNDSHGLPYRSSVSPFPQLSVQPPSQSRLTSDGQWDGWNNASTASDMEVAEILRNERLGLKYRVNNSSGNIHSRTF